MEHSPLAGTEPPYTRVLTSAPFSIFTHGMRIPSIMPSGMRATVFQKLQAAKRAQIGARKRESKANMTAIEFWQSHELIIQAAHLAAMLAVLATKLAR